MVWWDLIVYFKFGYVKELHEQLNSFTVTAQRALEF
jgi:hypothetical protein